jgi:hypothetical protein
VRLVQLQRAYRSLAWDTHGSGRIAVTARDCPAVHIYDVNSMQVGGLAGASHALIIRVRKYVDDSSHCPFAYRVSRHV